MSFRTTVNYTVHLFSDTLVTVSVLVDPNEEYPDMWKVIYDVVHTVPLPPTSLEAKAYSLFADTLLSRLLLQDIQAVSVYVSCGLTAILVEPSLQKPL